jgi:hypothetical protein
VVLQRRGRAKHGHDPVTGELVHGAAEAFDNDRRTADHFRHDLSQPLRTHCRRDVHRVHDISKEHGDLLVLGGRFGLDER